MPHSAPFSFRNTKVRLNRRKKCAFSEKNGGITAPTACNNVTKNMTGPFLSHMLQKNELRKYCTHCRQHAAMTPGAKLQGTSMPVTLAFCYKNALYTTSETNRILTENRNPRRSIY